MLVCDQSRNPPTQIFVFDLVDGFLDILGGYYCRRWWRLVTFSVDFDKYQNFFLIYLKPADGLHNLHISEFYVFYFQIQMHIKHIYWSTLTLTIQILYSCISLLNESLLIFPLSSCRASFMIQFYEMLCLIL